MARWRAGAEVRFRMRAVETRYPPATMDAPSMLPLALLRLFVLAFEIDLDAVR